MCIAIVWTFDYSIVVILPPPGALAHCDMSLREGTRGCATISWICVFRSIIYQQFIWWVSIGTKLEEGHQLGDNITDTNGGWRVLVLRREQCCSMYQNLIFFSWLNNIQLKCINHILFNHLSVDRHFGCFHLLAVVKNASMNIGMQVTVWILVFNSFECISQSGIASSMFNLLQSRQTVSQSSYTILHPTSCVWELQFLHIFTNTGYFPFLKLQTSK